MPSRGGATDVKLAAAAPPVDDLEARQWLANVRRRLTGAAPGPERLGRYVLRRRLGAGGMGIVYEAHDPELQRPVAIKVIAADRAGDEARLQQEARALAELDHDNVVEVYDVGTSDGSVYVVMELVVGVTLEAWVADDDPSIEECMEVLLAAGRGLAAAHRAGIVHRDVKPGNVMVRHDGRVCVLDFGLARRGTGHPAPATRDAGSAASVESSSGTTTTRGRGFAGTRAYAAPEQVRGDPVDARADQFSFCVTAAELLARRRAGEAGTDASWDGADANVRLETLIRLTPRRYRDAIGRGLSLDARDRYPSMDALLRALQSTGSRGRGRLLAAGALGAVVVPLFGGLADDAVMPCAEIVEGLAEELFEGDSNETQRQRWLTHWSEARRRACEEVRADPSRQFAVSCLDQQRKLYDAALQTAAAVSDPDKRLAVWEALPEPGDCDKAVASRPQARIVREQVAQSRLHHAAGELETATRLAVSSVRDARGLDEPLVLADALAAWGTIELERELFEEATRAFAESFDHAQRHRDDHLAAASALGMVKALVLMQDHGDDAQRWLRYASAAQARCGDRKLEVEVLRAAAMHARAKGELDAALQHLQAAHAQLRQADGAARAMSTVSHNLGTLHVLRGEYDRAIELIETARSQTESILGSEHPRLAEIEADLGAAHLYRGDIDAAQLWLDRATERWDRRPSEKPQRAAMTLSNVATVRWRKGDLDGAIEAYRSAVDLFVNALGPEHPHVAQARDNLGVALFSAGRLDEALTEFLAAQILTEERLGPEHPNVAKILIHVAQVHEARGDFEEAFTRARRAADLGAATLGERHGEVGHALATLARIDIARGRQDDALVAARRALSIYEEVGVGALERAAVRATLAYARSHAQPRPNCRAPSAACDEALAQAHQALADYEAAGPAGDSGADALRTWAKPHFGQRWRG